jgi:hypothetical protein
LDNNNTETVACSSVGDGEDAILVAGGTPNTGDGSEQEQPHNGSGGRGQGWPAGFVTQGGRGTSGALGGGWSGHDRANDYGSR